MALGAGQTGRLHAERGRRARADPPRRLHRAAAAALTRPLPSRPLAPRPGRPPCCSLSRRPSRRASASRRSWRTARSRTSRMCRRARAAGRRAVCCLKDGQARAWAAELRALWRASCRPSASRSADREPRAEPSVQLAQVCAACAHRLLLPPPGGRAGHAAQERDGAQPRAARVHARHQGGAVGAWRFVREGPTQLCARQLDGPLRVHEKAHAAGCPTPLTRLIHNPTVRARSRRLTCPSW